MAEKRFYCELLTADGRVWDGEVASVVLPAVDGQIAILANRSPVLVALGGGALRLVLSGSDEALYYVVGGTARMEHNRLTILADECIVVTQLDSHDVWEELSAANALPRRTAEEFATREARLMVIREKFKLAQAHGRGKGSSR